MEPASSQNRFLQANARDLAGNAWARCVWGASVVVVIIGAIAPSVRPALWIIGFGAAGVTCVFNAVRSRRFHCAFTGPVLLLGALASAAKAAFELPIGWAVIGGLVTVLVIVPIAVELATGKTILGRCC